MRTLAAFLIVIMIWVVGLLTFADRIERSTPAADPAPADAIVALTGATIDRVTAAVTLLENEKGRRLLVSGVNPEVKPRELQEVSKAAKGLFNCCIQMGFEAADTHGNAAETAAWARRQGYKRLIIVTADYHMPRAILEIRRAAPIVELTPYPVATREVDARRWWKTSPGARRMILEYCKYLAVLGSEAFLKLGPKPDK